MTSNVPQLIAHRGFYKCKYPENSISAFRAAMEAGAPFIEFDIQMTKDHHFIIHHDKTFERTAGVEGEVNAMNFKDCLKVSVHQPDKYGTMFYPEMVPSLQDVMDLMDEYPEAKCLLEIKSGSLTKFGEEIYFQKLLPYLNRYENRIIVISFSESALRIIHDSTGCKTAWIFKEWSSKTQDEASELKPDIMMCTNSLIPDNEPLWDGYEFMIYGVSGPDMVLHYGLQGVKYVEIDDVERFLKNKELAEAATSHRIEKSTDADIQEFIANIPEGLRDEDFTCNAQEFAQIVGAQPKDVASWIRQERMPASPQGKGFCIDLDEALTWCIAQKKFDLNSAGEAVSLSQERLKQQVKNLKLAGKRAQIAIEIDKLKLEVERKRYVDIELVTEHIDSNLKEMVSSFRALGQQVALKLVSVSDRNKIQGILDKRVEEILDDIKEELSK